MTGLGHLECYFSKILCEVAYFVIILMLKALDVRNVDSKSEVHASNCAGYFLKSEKKFKLQIFENFAYV